MNRRLILTGVVAFGLGVGLTLAVIALNPHGEAASHATGTKRHPGHIRSISWSKAQRKLARCKVQAVEQARNRLVTLTLRKSMKVVTHEPALGDVVHELARVRSTCGEIKLSTVPGS